MSQEGNIEEIIHATKADENTYKITMALLEVFSNEDSQYYIDTENLEAEESSELIHSILNLVPNKVYASLTGKKLDPVEFNHLANKFVFKYTERGNSNA